MHRGAPGSSQVEYVAMAFSRADDQRKYRSHKSITEHNGGEDNLGFSKYILDMSYVVRSVVISVFRIS